MGAGRDRPGFGLLILLLSSLAAVAILVATKPQPDEPGAVSTLEQRPSWPYAWTGRIVQLAGRGELSADFDSALAAAMTLGPSERKMRTTLALTGLRYWEQLTPTGRQLTRDNIVFALRVAPHPLLTEAFLRRRESLVCELWDQGGDIAEVCRNYARLRQICDPPGKDVKRLAWCYARGAFMRELPANERRR